MTKSTSLLALAIAGAVTSSISAETIVFENPFEMKIQNNGLPSVLGTDVSFYFLDGGNPNVNDPTTGPGDTAHAYDFLRFENMFGSGPGQIPAGATVLSATLTMTTATVNNAQTGGAFGIAPLVSPFSASSLYADYLGLGTGYNAGPSYFNGYVGRPSGGFSGLTQPGTVGNANVTSLVQQWSANPANAHGFAIIPRTTDGWALETAGSPTPENRPKLTIEYTTAQTLTRSFQYGVNDYFGGTNLRIGSDAVATDGAFVNTTFLDGPNGTDSFDIQMLVRFDDIFGQADGLIQPGEIIRRAYLVLTTGETGESHSGGVFDVHPMLVPWDLLSTFDSFGGDGPTVEQGEIADAVSSVRGMIQSSRTYFDVTSAVQGWQIGEDNFGLNVQASTTDGWNVFWNGATEAGLRPELVVVTEAVPEPGAAMLLLSAGLGWLGFRRARRA